MCERRFLIAPSEFNHFPIVRLRTRHLLECEHQLASRWRLPNEMETLPVILLLLVAVPLLSIAARRVHLPYPTVMVLGGLGISLVPNLPHVEAKPELLMILFLPPLL